MLRKILFFLVFATLSKSATAQSSFNFGVKASVNFAGLLSDAGSYTIRPGACAGALARFSFGNQKQFISYVIESGLQYSLQGAKYNGGSINLSYLQVPVIIQRYFGSSGFYLETGSQAGLLVLAKDKIKSYGITDIKKDTKSFDFSLGAGLGYKLNDQMGIGVRYMLGITPVSNRYSSDRNSVISVGVFYVFGAGSDDY